MKVRPNRIGVRYHVRPSVEVERLRAEVRQTLDLLLDASTEMAWRVSTAACKLQAALQGENGAAADPVRKTSAP